MNGFTRRESDLESGSGKASEQSSGSVARHKSPFCASQLIFALFTLMLDDSWRESQKTPLVYDGGRSSGGYF